VSAKEHIAGWLRQADFTGRGCQHSHETIALAVGCSRRTVIRAIAELETEGWIVVRAKRNSRVCNIYRAPNWSPQKRIPTLKTLRQIRAIRRRNSAECHTEGTALLSRAPTTVGTHPFGAEVEGPERKSPRRTARTLGCKEQNDENRLGTNETRRSAAGGAEGSGRGGEVGRPAVVVDGGEMESNLRRLWGEAFRAVRLESRPAAWVVSGLRRHARNRGREVEAVSGVGARPVERTARYKKVLPGRLTRVADRRITFL